jgi:uncharacterized damage-inducible protein DinB
MPAPQRSVTADFAITQRELMLQGLEHELEAAKRVLSAVLDLSRDFRLDPKSRTAWELTWHLASSHGQMLEDVADLKFEMAPRFNEESGNAAELVEWYDTNCKRAIGRVRAMSSEQSSTAVDFTGVCNLPAVFSPGFVNNHSIHHRGQFAAFLLPGGSAVPAIYGGGAGEPWNP